MSKTVEILLREDIENLGNCGDVVRVASGYARNYLFPHRLAQAANAENIKMIARRQERYAIARAERLKEYEALAGSLAGVELHTVENADRDGRLYGSVNAAAIVKMLAEAGHEVAERQVRLAAPIKAVGATEILIHIYGEISVTIPLMVEPEGGFPEPEPEPAPRPKRDDNSYEMPEESLNG